MHYQKTGAGRGHCELTEPPTVPLRVLERWGLDPLRERCPATMPTRDFVEHIVLCFEGIDDRLGEVEELRRRFIL